MLVNEAAFALGEGMATEGGPRRGDGVGGQLSDTARSNGAGRSVFDRVLVVLEHLQREFGEDRYRPAPWLRRQVRADASGGRRAADRIQLDILGGLIVKNRTYVGRPAESFDFELIEYREGGWAGDGDLQPSGGAQCRQRADAGGVERGLSGRQLG